MQDKITTYDCPMCLGGKLIERENHRTGSKFLGCTRYPKCTYTQKVEEEDDRYPGGVPDATTRWE
jgi:ssDNA-binding Zn-finger/Zn-ribbon topoisomerase 1